MIKSIESRKFIESMKLIESNQNQNQVKKKFVFIKQIFLDTIFLFSSIWGHKDKMIYFFSYVLRKRKKKQKEVEKIYKLN